MKKRRILRVLSLMSALLLLCYIVVMGVLFRESKQDVVCKGLLVKIDSELSTPFVTEADIMSALKQAKLDPVNRPLDAIRTDRIEAELLKNEMIERADVYKTPSGAIRIDVRQKTPIMRVMRESGDFYIDSKGGSMPVSSRYAVHLPVAGGYIEKNEVVAIGLHEFALFLQEHEFWNHQIEQIYVYPDHEVELIARVGEHRILLGTFENFREKLEHLQLFYEQAMPKLGWERYSSINLKFKDQVVCTKK